IYRPSQSVINDIYITNHSALTEEIVVYTEAKGNVTVNYITLDIPMDCVEYASMDEVENNGQLIVAETDICEALFIIAHNIPSSVLSTSTDMCDAVEPESVSFDDTFTIDSIEISSANTIIVSNIDDGVGRSHSVCSSCENTSADRSTLVFMIIFAVVLLLLSLVGVLTLSYKLA
ncbi:hypothetical protein ADUPG1_010508, partial [Aduncisulcus paluster]